LTEGPAVLIFIFHEKLYKYEFSTLNGNLYGEEIEGRWKN